MFDDIADSYDLMNRLMTFGQDQKWRRFVVDTARVQPGGSVLDLACGTGDIAGLFHESVAGVNVVGADFSGNMLAEARRRFPGPSVSWHVCDANELPYSDNSFDAVTFGYLLRNVDDSAHVLKEVWRVLKPGGRAVCLDTTPPEKDLLYPFINLYLRVIVPLLGRLVARDKAAYAYLTGSTMGFHEADELAELFRRAGYNEVGYRKFMCRTISIHWGVK
jgi:demethylmenaquinone methyltransferase/2-methoxy-6-polyprenyl-1,4-benzoquinol methylase